MEKLIIIIIVAARKKVGAERCECVFDVHTPKAGKELKVGVLLLLWRVNIKSRLADLLNIPVEDFHT